MARKGSSSPVRSQMPKGRLSAHGNPGEYDRNRAPFTQPHDLGNGGIPCKFFEDMGAKVATTQNAGMADASGGNNRQRKPMGQRRFAD